MYGSSTARASHVLDFHFPGGINLWPRLIYHSGIRVGWAEWKTKVRGSVAGEASSSPQSSFPGIAADAARSAVYEDVYTRYLAATVLTRKTLDTVVSTRMS